MGIGRLKGLVTQSFKMQKGNLYSGSLRGKFHFLIFLIPDPQELIYSAGYQY